MEELIKFTGCEATLGVASPYDTLELVPQQSQGRIEFAIPDVKVNVKENAMTYEDIFERLEGQTVVEVAEAKGGGLAILFDDGPTILVVGGDNETMCVQGVEAWEKLWHRIKV